MVGWQLAQSVPVGCGAGGGTPWQLPQVAWLPSTWVHTGSGAPPVEGDRRARQRLVVEADGA